MIIGSSTVATNSFNSSTWSGGYNDTNVIMTSPPKQKSGQS